VPPLLGGEGGEGGVGGVVGRGGGGMLGGMDEDVGGVGSIGGGVSEAWLSTLEVNAAFDRPWVEAAVGWLAGGAAAGLVVDVGCGAGGAACAFARRAGGGAVVAVDRDPRLLAVAGRRAVAEGVADRVRWATGEVGRLPVAPGAADLVWASGVVHHVADQQAAVDELAGLLVPGGTLALVEGGLPLRCLPHEIGLGRPGLEARIDEARARWFDDLRAELDGPPLPYGWPAALARAGLVDVRSRSFLAEAAPPLDAVGAAVVRLHLTSALTELGDRLAADDRAVLARLLDPADPADPEGVDRRDDLIVTAVRTVHAATRPG
jgi:SAM-dependent methyltransferase